MANPITVTDLHKTYKAASKSVAAKHVLRGLSFTIDRPGVFTFLGHNGAGKTTLIKILSTLLSGDSGDANICGFDVAKQPGHVREIIAMTGQYAAVDEQLTGRENIEFFGRLRGLRKADAAARATELLEKFELAHAGDQPVNSYSGGMRRRLDISVSLVTPPKVLFLDEPSTGLDPVSRNELWALIRRLTDTGMTIILTTQYLEEADALSDRIFVLKDGVVALEGTPSELRHQLGDSVLRLRFDGAQAASAAHERLRELNVDARVSPENPSIVVVYARESMAPEVILSQLAEAGRRPTEFSLAAPTLDEVFIQLNRAEAGQ
ncbi:ATP-binding cassette domain-containing protein [Corynebacterium sp.]|uniref:ATP-binding cassette domain-containing protein n=1 Tax=Corynebacterium sp. TaxID=1720 RepID=UPI0026DBAB40|nr:ATP-binding cassette domain-containing protein [Corynebacterium sp.]MDO5077826.1 ATP-binding cassette domain-containing protein [Corynebacterium sp.]